ncbi:MAG: SCO family protein [Gemmatimonadota bacterium]
MMRPPQLARCITIAMLLALGCSPGQPKGFSGEGLSAPMLLTPLPKPELVLTTTDGASFDLKRETEGFVTLLFFGYTSCPDLCPVQLANIATAMHRMDPELASRIKVVFVTVDPRRDTPTVVRAWLDHFDRRFVGLTGDSASVASAFTQLRLGHPMAPLPASSDSTSYTINHTVVVLAFTTDNLAHVAYPSGIRADDWGKDLAILAKSF